MIAKGWDTWDVRCLNAVMMPCEMLEVRIGLYDTRDRVYQDEFQWKHMKRLGSHMLGGYFDVDLMFQGMSFTIRFASEDDRFVCKIVPKEAMQNIRFFISFMLRWGAKGMISCKQSSAMADTGKRAYEFTVAGTLDEDTKANVAHQGMLLYSQEPIYIRCNHKMNVQEMDEFLLKKYKECTDSQTRSGGVLQDSAEAVVKGILWNTVYDITKNRVCTPISRKWCLANGKSFGSYVLFGWDTFFNGLLAGIQDRELAYAQIRSIFEEVNDRGMIPNCGSERGASWDRSQPPVGAYCVLKLYKQFGGRSLIEEFFEKLLKWNRWWMQYRDGNKDGLLEWGSERNQEVERIGFQNFNLQAAKYESGLDDSPMYDDAVFNTETGTMEMTDIGINSLYALDCWALHELARIIGRIELAEELKAEFERIKTLVNKELWDESSGIYRNRLWNGALSGRISPTSFYPMIAGIASAAQAERMVAEHLLNENEFWGRYVIPSISKDDPAFSDQKFWRGRIWAPMNFLVSEGLKRYGMDDISYEFSKRSRMLFLEEWQKYNHIHENYHAVTGDGNDDISDPVYTWGALLAYIAIGELAEAQPWGFLRFGNLGGEDAFVENLLIDNDHYSIYTGRGLTVHKNGSQFIKADVPVIIHSLNFKTNCLDMCVKYKEKGWITLNLPENIHWVHVEMNHGKALTIQSVNGTASFGLG